MNSFDLMGDLSLIIILLALNFLSSRSPSTVSQWDDDNSDNNNLFKCPQCDGTKIYMGEICSLCEGAGYINSSNYNNN
jgi:hypothetical protein